MWLLRDGQAEATHAYHAITEKLRHPGFAFNWLSMEQFHLFPTFLVLFNVLSTNRRAEIVYVYIIINEIALFPPSAWIPLEVTMAANV